MNAECGTTSGYHRHRKLGEKPCRPCKEARNTYRREHRRRQKLAGGIDRVTQRPGHRMRAYRVNGAYACICGAAQYLGTRQEAYKQHRAHLLSIPLQTVSRAERARAAKNAGRPLDPTAELSGPCCPAEWIKRGNRYYCTALDGHEGDHIAGDGTWIKATWRDAA